MITLIAGKQRVRHHVRLLLRGFAAILLGGFLVLAGAQSASAHAELLSTTPEDGAVLTHAPAEAVLTFNEPVRLIDGSIRLFPGDDDPLVLDARVVDAAVSAPFPSDLAEGRYALSYRVVSADGHPISGAITFTIGDVTAASALPVIDTQTPRDTQTAVSVVTAAQYLSLLVFAGLLFFIRGIRRTMQRIDRRSARLLGVTGVTAVAASLLLVPISALNVTGGALGEIVVPSTWAPGVFWAPAVAAILVLIGVLGASVVAVRPPRSASLATLGVSLACLALAAPVLSGHSQLIDPRALIILADLGHLAAGSFWVGGVIGLIVLLSEANPTPGSDEAPDPVRVADVLRRFSRAAVWSVVVLAISGTIMGVMIVGSLDALVTTGYGLTLLLKVGIVLPVIAIAGYNRRRLLPALAVQPERSTQWRMLTRTLGYEAALLVVIIVVTGFLTNLSPTHDHSAAATATTESTENTEPLTIRRESQNLAVDGVLAPGRVGENEITFTLRYDSEPVTPESVTLRISLPEQDFGPIAVTPQLDPATGAFTAALDLPLGGEWQMQIVARVSTFAEPIVTVPVTVR